ncbi:YciI family protein [Gallaecimonas xiamenensis]|uniref:PhnB-like protein n=1 Tax=Gallaecimonas xiamenensis 3-C-1 TaxID=745411 RepID=K2JG23_9GAMM|nr:YciI family protein [Gallaecimonas xiamenensis]EKE69594.1 PhnB-like protein [Gallaecimonas xiamenensis 3-C-1]
MRVIIQRKADAYTEAGQLPDNELLVAMGQFHERMLNAGILRDGMGLKPSAQGKQLRFEGGQLQVTDGPFSETKELLAGFSLLEVDSMDEALAWAKQWPKEDGDVTLELRPLFEMEDFAPGSGVELHKALWDKVKAGPALCNAYLNFKGDCRQAFDFYASALGAKIEVLMTHGDTPAAAEVPPQWHDKIIHGRLRLGNWLLMASDAPEEHYQAPQGMHLHLGFSDPAEAKVVFDQLAEGGQVTMPFSETFWAKGFGMVTDRFGVPWMINCEQDNKECC